MENNYIIHDGDKYVRAHEHETIIEEYKALKEKFENILNENAELRMKSEIDPLTHVYRRGAAIERINQLLKGGMKSCALIVLDLDNFKYINDTFGHVYGDAVISTTASCIVKEIGETGVVGRFGGDEFLIFLPGAGEEKAMTAASNIVNAIKSFDTEPGDHNALSCSAGVATGSGKVTYSSLFSMADKALYNAKHNGKSRAELYNHANMSDINEACITYTDDEELAKNPYSDIVSRAIEMASRAGTTEDAVQALLTHIATNFGIIDISILATDVSKDMITVTYNFRKTNPSEERSKNNVGYYLHQDLTTFRELLSDRTVMHIPQKNLDTLSQKFAREMRDNEFVHRLYYVNKSDNGNYTLCSFAVPGPLKYWGQDELRAIAEISAIIMVYADKVRYISKHEESLQEKLDTDQLTGAYTMSKFYQTSGLIRKLAMENNVPCYLLNIKIINARDFNLAYSFADGDEVLKNFYKSLEASPYKQNGITAHDAAKFITIMRTTDDSAVIKKSAMDNAKRFIDEYTKIYPDCPLKIAVGITEVHQNDTLAMKLDEAYRDRTLVE